jgi:hypothetical protein
MEDLIMTKFGELKQLTNGKILPLTGKNENGEIVIIEYGISGEERFFRVTTCQHNNWCRINTYWEDGTIEETYRK